MGRWMMEPVQGSIFRLLVDLRLRGGKENQSHDNARHKDGHQEPPEELSIHVYTPGHVER